jgi:hypothetical protein
MEAKRWPSTFQALIDPDDARLSIPAIFGKNPAICRETGSRYR